MIDTSARRSFLTAALLAAPATVLGGCLPRESGPSSRIVMWTTLADQMRVRAQQAVIDAFEEQNPDLQVDLVPKPEQGGTGDTSTILTAVRGGVQPDVYMMGRFPVTQFAALGLLQSLEPHLQAEQSDFMDQYYRGAVNEVVFDGAQYSLPMVMDARALFINNEMLREADVDPEILDPSHGPPSISTVMDIAAEITTESPSGAYEQLGFIPWLGEGWALTYAIGNHATFLDESACTLTLDSDPGIRKAYEDFSAWANQLDYARVDAFEASYSPPGAPPSQTSFLSGRLAMLASGNYQVSSLQEYAPDLDYSVTYLPVPEEGQQPYTWSGGAGLVIPAGSQNQENAWRLMKFFISEEGQRIYCEGSGDLPSSQSLADELSEQQGQGFFSDVLQYTTSRVPVPVGSTLFDAMGTAQEAVLLGEDPQSALTAIQDQVQPQMDQYCPYPLPDEYQQGEGRD